MKGFFPLQSAVVLYQVGLLVRQARLRMGLRQQDLADRAKASLRTIRSIEAGRAGGVSLEAFMVTLFAVGVSDHVFQALRNDPTLQTGALEENRSKRVRLARNREEDF